MWLRVRRLCFLLFQKCRSRFSDPYLWVRIDIRHLIFLILWPAQYFITFYFLLWILISTRYRPFQMRSWSPSRTLPFCRISPLHCEWLILLDSIHLWVLNRSLKLPLYSSLTFSSTWTLGFWRGCRWRGWWLRSRTWREGGRNKKDGG